MAAQDPGQQAAFRQGATHAGAGNLLRRKTAAAPAPEGVRLTPERALRIAFGRASTGFPPPGLRMSGFSSERSTISELSVSAPTGGLSVLLVRDGIPGGALHADMGLVSALVEAETTGRLSRTAPEERPATRLDLLVVSRLLDGALAAFDEVGAGLAIAAAASGWRLGEMLPAFAALPLYLDEAPMRLMRVAFNFDTGAADEAGGREGRLWLATPLHAPRPRAELAPQAPQLADCVLAARAEVRAVLARLDLTLEAVAGWEVGTLLPIDRAALSDVRLEDISGATIAGGRLGQIHGSRAVRLHPDSG